MKDSSAIGSLEESTTNSGVPLVHLDHPRYGGWFWWAGVFLFLCASGVSLIFTDLVKRLKLTTGVDIVDLGLPFIVGASLAWVVSVSAIAIGVDKAQSQRLNSRSKKSTAHQKRWLTSTADRVGLTLVLLGVIVAGVRVAKTMESRETERKIALETAKVSYEERLDAWQASEDGKEYARAKAQIRELRTLGARLLEDGRWLSHPKKRSDGAALLRAADAIDIKVLEKTMPKPPDTTAIAPAMPWWKFANIVVWPALLEFVATELLVLSIAFWASKAFLPIGSARERAIGDSKDHDEEYEDDEGEPAAGLRLVPEPVHPAFDCFDFAAVNAVFENEPDGPGAEAWREAKQGLDLVSATWRGVRITAGRQWTKRIGSTRRRYVWPVVVVALGRTVFIGTQDALRLVNADKSTTDC